ncbi:uncharacterized protein LOC127240419 [Andrographis paniculata]|uniref:uncharacterized protein LOC127240419 n=1 Tax=Andrographis paniculata TaxID=175694 RepID=UPI0021E7C464|nr:uncharacterized protein LOC127240419 [Andrographis paniculata]
MGNCQAAAVADVVVIQHPGGGSKAERISGPVTANEIMSSNPGHYVVQEVMFPADTQAPPVKQMKLLRPGDTLAVGHVYRLISFEDVLKVFAAKKSVRLGKLLKDSVSMESDPNRVSGPDPQAGFPKTTETEHHQLGGGTGRQRSSGRWRPALHSISELG